MRVFNDVYSSTATPDKPLFFLILDKIEPKNKKNALTTRAKTLGSIEKLITVVLLHSNTF